MKQVLKISMAVLAISTVTTFIACNNRGEKITNTTDSTKTELAHEGGDHIYACPMHPEVTGKEGDNCSKCGMKLEHNDNAVDPGNTEGPGNVTIKFTIDPVLVNPGQEVTLSLIPKMKDKPGAQVPLDVEHTKKIHLIVVSEDLSWFTHIHPELNADGSYTVKEKFPFPGKYTLFADYKPSGGNHTVDNLSLTVAGTAPAAKSYVADKLTGAAGDGFAVSLKPESGKFLTNMPMHINAVMMLNDKEVDVNTLEDYLGAKAHMVVVSLAGKKYLHVHPSVEGGKFDLHTTFDKPGIYRGWIQFQSKGKVYTSDFVMNVAEGTTANMKGMKHDDMKDMKDMKQ
mgnify:CR=1 FL=1